MRKKSKRNLEKVLEVLALTFAGLFVLVVITAAFMYFRAKHNFESKYHQAYKDCGGQPYVILYEVGDGSVVSYWIGKTSSDYHYQLITFDSVYGYACSAKAAKDKILNDHPGVPENDLDIQTIN